MTCQEYLGHLAGKKLVYLGNADNNVAHSLLIAATYSGLQTVVSCPKACNQIKNVVEQCLQISKLTNATLTFTEDPYQAVKMLTVFTLMSGFPWEKKKRNVTRKIVNSVTLSGKQKFTASNSQFKLFTSLPSCL